MSEKVPKMTTQNAPKQVPKPFQNHQKNNPKTKPENMTKKIAKVAPVGSPLGSLLAPLARLWAPLGLNWSSVWLPFAPPASSNVDFLANPRKWTQNKPKLEPKWMQNNPKRDLKMKPKLTESAASFSGRGAAAQSDRPTRYT